MMPLPEHWQYAALGALSMTPILGVFWSTARGWRLRFAPLQAENDRLHIDIVENSELNTRLCDQVIELVCKLNDERALTADQSARLTEIIKRGKTKNPNSTVQAMVRIAEGG